MPIATHEQRAYVPLQKPLVPNEGALQQVPKRAQKGFPPRYCTLGLDLLQRSCYSDRRIDRAKTTRNEAPIPKTEPEATEEL